MTSIEEIVENFAYLDDWDDRYRYLIELGRELEPMSEAEHSDINKVQGCVSQVWLKASVGDGDDPVISFRGDSDAHIVSGLVAITLSLFSNRRASEIVQTEEAPVFQSIGLQEHLTPQRSNGLRSMVSRIKSMAQAAGK